MVTLESKAVLFWATFMLDHIFVFSQNTDV